MSMSQQTGTKRREKKGREKRRERGQTKTEADRPELNKGIGLFRCNLLLQTNHGLYCYGPTSNGLCWALSQTSDSKMESRLRLTTM